MKIKMQAHVNDVLIELDAILAEVKLVKKESLIEMKTLSNPPKAIKIVLSAICILNLEYIKKNGELIKSTQGERKDVDYFETAKRYLLNDPKELVEILKNYDKNNVPNHVIIKIEQLILPDPEFNIQRVQQCSAALKHLYQWVLAMY